MKQKVMESLLKKREEEIAARPVKFRAKIGRYVIKSARHSSDPVTGQRYVDYNPETGPLMLDMDFGGATRPYDPAIEEDRLVIERVREYMAAPQNQATIQRYRLEEVPHDAPARPFRNWESKQPSAIADLVVELGEDIDACIDYEESLAEPRQEVIAVLMDLRENGAPEKAAETTEPIIGD